MKTLSRLLAFFFLLNLGAQTRLVFNDQSFGCSYVNKPTTGSVYAFETNSEAEEVIKQILQVSGLAPTFRIYAAGVENAEARIIGEERVIIYNQNFMADVEAKTSSKWAAVSILAHEVAHHVNGHTIKAGGSQPKLELEADKWSGFVLYKLNAKLSDAKVAMEKYASTVGSSTHPSRADRLQAIAVGWSNAKYLDKNLSKIPSDTEPLPNPAPPKPKPDPPLDIHTTRLNFQYLGNSIFPINADVKIFINGVWYTPSGNIFSAENIPLGNNHYRITGNLNYNIYGIAYSLPVNNDGQIYVSQNGTVYIIVDYNMIFDSLTIRLSNTNY